jgi:adenine-specific DNA methylase
MTHDHFCPRLIEVALPIREISAESVRDKNLHHAHIRNLHVWWARRPLSASRAVIFASLVPDPDDPSCPDEFRRAVERYLRTDIPSELKYYRQGREIHRDEDPYHPYEGISDTLRNRLLTFIAKWSPEALAFETGKGLKEPKPAELLDDRSLVKWETSDPENLQGIEILGIARELIKTAHGGRIPTVLDPFAGGGAIPLEAGRLGCHPIANDYNPVAYLILRATCEFPQKYGKPGRRKVVVEDFGKKAEREVKVQNVLIHDFAKWANWILEKVRDKVGYLYPPGQDGRPVVGYLWVRTAPCANFSCCGEIPVLRSLLICNKKDKKVALTLQVDKFNKRIRFGIVKGSSVQQTDGTKRKRGPAMCPFCNQPTSEPDLRRAGLEGRLGERVAAVIVEGTDGKDYRIPEEKDLSAFEMASKLKSLQLQEPIEEGQWNVKTWLYGMTTWGSLFNRRQLAVNSIFVGYLHEALKNIKNEIKDKEYQKAIAIYLGLWISKIVSFNATVCIWAATSEIIKNPFGRQAIPMNWDYPEVNPISDSSGSASTQLRYMLDVIKHEQSTNGQPPAFVRLGDAATLDLKKPMFCVTVTDPPYFDQIAYADLSDYFFVWLKRTLGEEVPDILTTPLSPKSDEATALKHRHGGDEIRADQHFKSKLTQAFAKSLQILEPDGVISIMFAHQSTKAWTALVHAIFEAGLTVDATWPIDTEMITALKANMSSLSSSVTVVCRPRVVGSAASFKDVRKEIEKVVQESIKRFWGYGLRGADLIVACYGPAVGVFGKYERVEKADGTPVEIPELLELARIAARDAIAGEFRGDNLSTLYYVWANLYGAAEQTWDDARLVVQIGGDAESAMEVARGHGIFVVGGSKCRLALLSDREKRRGLGIDPNPPLIDALHRSMLLWSEEKRPELVSYLRERDLLEDGPFWKLAQALFEVLPRDTEDWKLISALLGERQTLRSEGKGLADQGPRYPLFGNR